MGGNVTGTAKLAGCMSSFSRVNGQVQEHIIGTGATVSHLVQCESSLESKTHFFGYWCYLCPYYYE